MRELSELWVAYLGVAAATSEMGNLYDPADTRPEDAPSDAGELIEIQEEMAQIADRILDCIRARGDVGRVTLQLRDAALTALRRAEREARPQYMPTQSPL